MNTETKVLFKSSESILNLLQSIASKATSNGDEWFCLPYFFNVREGGKVFIADSIVTPDWVKKAFFGKEAAVKSETIDLLNSIQEYMDSRSDVEGDSEHLRPNKEMQFVTEIGSLLEKIKP